MPRQARIDALGAVHHLICRGIERRKIFFDDTDRDDFLSRLGRILLRTSTRCYAWALIPNHFHLLLETGRVPIATVMGRLLTGYAVGFNHRHNRVGHLFQNRYKSILCQKETYLLELVRYIHLNPIRAKLVRSMQELASYSYCGHVQLLDRNQSWQTTEDILARFGSSAKEAWPKYEAFVADGIAVGKRADLVGGGLVRSAGGWKEVVSARRLGLFLKSDERILGDPDFVESVLAEAKEQTAKITDVRACDLEQVAKCVADLLKIDETWVWRRGKYPIVVQARSLLCYWAIRELRMTETALAEKLGVTQSAVSKAAARGEQVAITNGWSFSRQTNS